MKIWKKAVLFYLGGCAYMALELLWRGYTHGSMFLAGGICFLLIGHLNAVRPRLMLPLRAMFGALIITSVELLFGLLVNRDYTVWDYRGNPGNLWGQICPAFMVLWAVLTLPALGLHSVLEENLHRRMLSPVQWS